MLELLPRVIRIICLVLTLVFMAQGLRWPAFAATACLLLANFWHNNRIRSTREEQWPRTAIWSRTIYTALLAGVFGVLLFEDLLTPDPLFQFPKLLAACWVLLLVQLVAYPLYAFSALRSGADLGGPPFWSRAARIALTVAAMLFILKIDHFREISVGAGLLLMLASGAIFLYRYYREPEHRKPLTLASQLTVSRIVLTPVFILVFFYDNNLDYSDNNLVFKALSLIMVVGFMVTDFLDGHIARKYNQVSTLGKFLDPFSDKISNMSVFLCFLASGYANIWMVALIYFREASVETLRTLAASQGMTIAARRSGKWKTAIQMSVILLILIGALDPVQAIPGVAEVWETFPQTLMGIATAVTLLSGIDYFVASRDVLKRYL